MVAAGCGCGLGLRQLAGKQIPDHDVGCIVDAMVAAGRRRGAWLRRLARKHIIDQPVGCIARARRDRLEVYAKGCSGMPVAREALQVLDCAIGLEMRQHGAAEHLEADEPCWDAKLFSERKDARAQIVIRIKRHHLVLVLALGRDVGEHESIGRSIVG